MLYEDVVRSEWVGLGIVVYLVTSLIVRSRKNPRTGMESHGVWVSCLLSTLGFIDLRPPFIGGLIIGLHPFRVTPTHSSPSSSSGSLLWGNPHIHNIH
ncbi:MAG: hypothetical protein QXK60_06060 [Zestosphaera sp.]